MDEIEEIEKLTLRRLFQVMSDFGPDSSDTVWSAGRNAPTIGEDFRVRLNFSGLKEKAAWRVQRIHYQAGKCLAQWQS